MDIPVPTFVFDQQVLRAQGMSETNAKIDHAHKHDDEHDHEHHIVSPMIYLSIVLALLFFTGTTVWVSYVDLGEMRLPGTGLTIYWNPVVALAIACTKMVLVVLFFMHVKYSTKLTKLTVMCGLFTFIALIGMTLTDYVTRAWGRW
jgi:cytochrome c oxidase subunit 4